MKLNILIGMLLAVTVGFTLFGLIPEAAVANHELCKTVTLSQ
ncbi:hypothetical protein [Pantoea agglomerans]